MNINVDTARFASAFTDAVIRYLTTDTPQEVFFDHKAGEFRSSPLEPGMSPEDVDLYVGDDWEKLVRGVSAPNSKSFSHAHFRSESVKAMTNSAEAKYWVEWLTGGARRANEAV